MSRFWGARGWDEMHAKTRALRLLAYGLADLLTSLRRGRAMHKAAENV